jgi:hypothetical protein
VVTRGRDHISQQYPLKWQAEQRRDALEYFFRAIRKDYHSYEDVLVYDITRDLWPLLLPHMKRPPDGLFETVERFVRAAVMAEKEICSL